MASRALLDLLAPGAVVALLAQKQGVEMFPHPDAGETRDNVAAGALEELRQDLVRLRRVAAGR